MAGPPTGYTVSEPTPNAGGPPPGYAVDSSSNIPAGYALNQQHPRDDVPSAARASTDVDPQIQAAVQAAAAKHHVDPALLLAIGEQETGLGKSSVYDPIRGVSRTPGNAGHGIWQLDPASGASASDLERASHDVFFAADKAAEMMANNLQAHKGNVAHAVASYNAGSPTPTGMNYAQQVLANVEKWNPFRAHGPVDTVVRKGATMLHDAAQNTMGAMDAVLGAPQRFVEGMATSHGDVGHGAYVATHPHDEALQDRELTALMQMLHVPETKGNDWKAKTLRFIEHFGVQTGTDPTLLVPFLGELRLVSKGATVSESMIKAAQSVGFSFAQATHLDQAAKAVARSGIAKGVKQLDKARVEGFGIRPELNPHLTPGGKDVRLSIEQAHRDYEAKQAAIDANLLRQNADALHNARSYQDLPEAIKVRQLIEPWLHGTPKMRQEAESLAQAQGIPDLGKRALELGVVDPHEYARLEKAPSGLLNYDLRQDYVTMITPKSHWGDLDILKTAGGKHHEEFAGFEKERRNEGQLPNDIHDLMENRFRIGRARIRQEGTDQETQRLLTEHPEYMRNPNAKPGNVVGELSHSPKRVAPDSPLRGFGRAYKFAISMNPFPHFFKNVGTLAYLWGGPEAFGRGIGHAAMGLSSDKIQRLTEMGAGPGYVHDIERTLESAPVAAIRAAGRASEFIGNRLELGYRQALLEQLDRTMGSSTRVINGVETVDKALEYQKAAVIRQALGDYRNAALFTSALEALGGAFPIFRTSIVPRAVGTALKRRPGYVETFPRAQKDINSPGGPMGGSPSEFEIAGPVDDLSRMLLQPEAFGSSSATIGPWSYLLWMADPASKKTFGGVVDRATQFLPYGNTLQNVGALQPLLGGYGTSPGVTPEQSAFSSVLGSYFRFRPSPAAEKKWREQEQRAK